MDEEGKQVCKNCPAGWVQPLETGTPGCNGCERGQVQSAVGEKFCDECPEGYFVEKTEEEECKMCPKGRYGDSKGLKADGVDSKDADTGKECASCPRGRYLDLKGSPAVSSCKVCMQGYYLDTTNDMDSSFNTGVFNCKKCPRGRFGAAEALEAAGGFLGSSGIPTKDCTGCSIGYYLEEEAKTMFDDCIPCDAGRFQPVIGANDKDDCKPCARGYYSEQVAQDAADDCAECVIGMYADEFGNSLQEDCKPCPRGTWSNVTAIISKLASPSESVV